MFASRIGAALLLAVWMVMVPDVGPAVGAVPPQEEDAEDAGDDADRLTRWFQEHELYVAGTILAVDGALRRVLLRPEGKFFETGWTIEGSDAREPIAARLVVDLADAVGMAIFRDSDGGEEVESLAAAWAWIEPGQTIHVAKWPGRDSNAFRVGAGATSRGGGIKDVIQNRLPGSRAPTGVAAMKISGAVRVRIMASSRDDEDGPDDGDDRGDQ